MTIKKISFFLLLQLSLVTFAIGQGKKAISKNTHPAWIMQGNIYEVNVRQYTKEGTFNAFSKHLNRLKDMGVQTIWFMPINPISKLDRKGTLGSYYAVSDYTSVNPEFGTLNDWKNIVKKIHSLGMKVIIDWVPNHTGADHYWVTKYPDFFVKDNAGKPAVAYDWADTRQLDYNNIEMQDSMIAAMKYWLTKTGIDGFREDVAWNVPGSFWSRCIASLKKVNSNMYWLAEGDRSYLHPSGFDATYPWDMFHMMVKVAAGERPAFALDSVKNMYDTMYPKNCHLLYFTSNHDENSWNKSDYGTFPGPVHAPFAVFTLTMDKSVPLIYSGQEEPLLRPLQFFEKDPIVFSKYQRVPFYKTMLSLRKRNAALSADAGFKKINAGDDKAIYAYTRQKGSSKVLVILNFSAADQSIAIKDKSLWGNPVNVFTGKNEALNNKSLKLEPWGYAVYEYGAAGK